MWGHQCSTVGVIFLPISSSNDVQITPNRSHFVWNFVRSSNQLRKLPLIIGIRSITHLTSIGHDSWDRLWALRNGECNILLKPITNLIKIFFRFINVKNILSRHTCITYNPKYKYNHYSKFRRGETSFSFVLRT